MEWQSIHSLWLSGIALIDIRTCSGQVAIKRVVGWGSKRAAVGSWWGKSPRPLNMPLPPKLQHRALVLLILIKERTGR